MRARRPKAGSAGSISTPDEKHGSQGSAALDRPLPELESAVRSLPFDPPQERLRRGQRQLQDDVQRDRTSPARPATARPRATPTGRSRPVPLIAPGGDKGLVVRCTVALEARPGRFATPGAPTAQRDQPGRSQAATNTCAACHARRSTLVEHGATGCTAAGHPSPGPADPAHLLRRRATARRGLSSGTPSCRRRMYQKGVTCMDCHDAHSLKLRLDGNTLCARCHSAAVFDTPQAPWPQGRHARARSASNATCRSATTWWSTPGATTPSACRARICQRRARQPRTPAPAATPTSKPAMGRGGHGQVVRHRLACTATRPAARCTPVRPRV